MSEHDMMPIETDPETMWSLTEDRQAVRLTVPPLPLERDELSPNRKGIPKRVKK
jgi:hypothetical protein